MRLDHALAKTSCLQTNDGAASARIGPALADLGGAVLLALSATSTATYRKGLEVGWADALAAGASLDDIVVLCVSGISQPDIDAFGASSAADADPAAVRSARDGLARHPRRSPPPSFPAFACAGAAAVAAGARGLHSRRGGGAAAPQDGSEMVPRRSHRQQAEALEPRADAMRERARRGDIA